MGTPIPPSSEIYNKLLLADPVLKSKSEQAPQSEEKSENNLQTAFKKDSLIQEKEGGATKQVSFVEHNSYIGDAYKPGPGVPSVPTNPYYGDGYRPSPYAQGVGATGNSAPIGSGVPPTLQKVWNEVKADGYISAKDYNKLVFAAAPNGDDKELEQDEFKFLLALKKEVENSNDPKGVLISQITFLNPDNKKPVNKEDIPTPPPDSDIDTAFAVVEGDLANLTDPAQGARIVAIHMEKASDYRNKAESFCKEAEKESREAAYAAEQLIEHPEKLSDVVNHKSRAMELLKTAKEYTKAVYDECLYGHAANEILKSKFPEPINSDSVVADGWKNWSGGKTENKYVFFTEVKKSAPEMFNQSLNTVNANIGRATQIVNDLSSFGN